VSLAEKGDMGALMAYTGQSGAALNYMQLLQQLMMTNPPGAVSLAKMVAKQARLAVGGMGSAVGGFEGG
jgi:clathrin heavy chain